MASVYHSQTAAEFQQVTDNEGYRYILHKCAEAALRGEVRLELPDSVLSYFKNRFKNAGFTIHEKIGFTGIDWSTGSSKIVSFTGSTSKRPFNQ